MKIEVLYPEICNLNGDLANPEYLHRAIPGSTLIKTAINDQPLFTREKVDFVYIGSMTEIAQEISTHALMPHRERISEMTSQDSVFLATGNALDIFGGRIENEDGSYFKTLGLFNLYAKRQMMKRYNSIFLGTFGDIDIVGFTSRFSHIYELCSPADEPAPSKTPALFEAVRGAGRTPEQKDEGIRLDNFFASYLLGPLLILNPPFTRYILSLLGHGDVTLPYSEASIASYKARLAEFKDPKTGTGY